MTQAHKSVSDLVKSLASDEEFKQLAIDEIEGRQIAKLLFFLRCKRSLSQKEMAKKIGCSQSQISKIESSHNKDLSVKDLLAYGEVFDLQLDVGYNDPSTKIVDHIKYHAFKMKGALDRLCELAKDDPALIKGVKNFFGEAFVNVLVLIAESYKKLPKEKKEKEPTVHVSAPPEMKSLSKKLVKT